MTPQEILQIVSDQMNVPVKDIIRRSNKRERVFCRHLYFYLACKYTRFTLTNIGKEVNRSDHTTVIHGRDKIKNLIETQDIYCEAIFPVEKIISDKVGVNPLQVLQDNYNRLERKYNRVCKMYLELLKSG